MNASGDAAEQVVRLSLEGMEVSAKIVGTGAKELSVLLYTLLKDKRKSAGKTKLINLLKSGKELKIFSVEQKDFKKFTQEAKNYGILYSALINKKNKNNDGVVDIIVKAEDAPRINRIVDRFILSKYDETSIKSDIEKTKKQKQTLAKGTKNKSKEELIHIEKKDKPLKKDEKSSNPRLAKTVKNPQSEPSSKMQKNLDQGTKVKTNKPSVKKKLEDFKAEVKVRDTKERNPEIIHIQPKKKKEKSRL